MKNHIKQTVIGSAITTFALFPSLALAHDDSYISWIDIEFGEHNQSITEVKEALNKLGYFTGDSDNYFDSSLKEAIYLFQEKEEITPDGTLTEETVLALISELTIIDIEENIQSEELQEQETETEQEELEQETETEQEEELEQEVETEQEEELEQETETEQEEELEQETETEQEEELEQETETEQEEELEQETETEQEEELEQETETEQEEELEQETKREQEEIAELEVKEKGNMQEPKLKKDQIFIKKVPSEPQKFSVQQLTQNDELYDGVYDPRVVELKKYLAILGHSVPGNLTEHYGPLTTQQVVAFQKDYGIATTGIVDTKTFELIKGLANRPLQSGMYREDVKELKDMLSKVGFSVSPNPNNYFGPITTNELKRFQKQYNLTADGIADDTTLRKLEEVSSLSLYNGIFNSRVIILKKSLRILGYPVPGNETEHYGLLTEASVKAFQKRNGFNVTGIVDHRLLTQIEAMANGDLKEGMYRDDVIQLKKNLAKSGYEVSKNPNNYYGPITAQQVKNFQKDSGLSVTGVVDGSTLKHLQTVSNSTLADGDRKAEVVDLKKSLAILGFAVPGNNTEHFGPLTAEKVRLAQKKYGLKVTGMADKLTRDTLEQKANGALHLGMYRPDVITLKENLEKAGFKVSSKPNNYFGAVTEQKLKEFQRNSGLVVTGIADNQTLQKLKQIVEQTKTFTFEVKERFGHGVGMTQWGAYGMSLQGFSFNQILNHYYTGVKIEKDSNYQKSTIRVALAEKATTAQIGSTKSYNLIDSKGNVLLKNVIGLTTIQYVNGTYIIQTSSQRVESKSNLRVVSDGNIQFKGNQYKGELHFIGSLNANSSQSMELMDIVNHVQIDDYLEGVVPFEMIPSWNQLEAFKAQAVAARTYALYHLRPTHNYDVTNDTNSQVYRGIPSSDRTNALIQLAVTSTNGTVIKYNNRLIDALYSASASGHTVDAELVWGNDIPYLKGVKDPYDPSRYAINYTTYSIDLIDLSKKFQYLGLGKLVDLKFTTEFERLKSVELIFNNERKVITADQFTNVVGLPSKIMSIK